VGCSGQSRVRVDGGNGYQGCHDLSKFLKFVTLCTTDLFDQHQL
jgi:hypothetical protein